MSFWSTLAKIGGLAAAPVTGGMSTVVGDLLSAGGQGVGDATTAAGENRLEQEKLGLTANAQNINGRSAFENALINRATEEAAQRKNALQDVARASYMGAPSRSPFDPNQAGPNISATYAQVLNALEQQGKGALATGPKYSIANAADLKPYSDINIQDVPGATGTSQGTLSKIGQWLSPALTVAGKVAKLSTPKAAAYSGITE